jgi:hypothetical protein
MPYSSRSLALAPEISYGSRPLWSKPVGDGNAPTARQTGRENAGGSRDRHSAQRTTAHPLYEEFIIHILNGKCAVVSGCALMWHDDARDGGCAVQRVSDRNAERKISITEELTGQHLS